MQPLKKYLQKPVNRHVYFYGLVIAVGMLIGIHNVFSAVELPLEAPIFMVSAAMFGLQRPRQAWFSAFLLATCLYISHVVAICFGMGEPYVEANIPSAAMCYFYALPLTCFGATLGAVVRYSHDRSILTRKARERLLTQLRNSRPDLGVTEESPVENLDPALNKYVYTETARVSNEDNVLRSRIAR